MADEKTFIINLRREFSKKPIYRRAKKAVTAVKEYISKHLKVKEVKIANDLNMKIWERGRRHPPPKIKVKAIVKEGIAYVQLPDHSNIVPCGSGGVCSWGQRDVTWWNPLSLFNKRYCRQGQIYLGQPPECDGANGGATEVCCAPQTEETLLSAGMAMKAVVPLLYKDRYGTMEVTVK